jgi:hypothetical protein
VIFAVFCAPTTRVRATSKTRLDDRPLFVKLLLRNDLNLFGYDSSTDERLAPFSHGLCTCEWRRVKRQFE